MTNNSSEKVSNDYISLNACGRQHLFTKRRGSYRPYGRKDYHILYIAEGKCTVTENGEKTEAPKGSVIVYLPNQPQEYSFNPDDGSVSYYIHFTGSGCEQLMRDTALNQKNIFYIGKSHTLEELINTLINEYKQKLKFSNHRINGILLEIISLIGRKNAYMMSGGNDTNKRFEIVCEYIHNNFSANLTMKELATMCNLSESRFSHLFTEIFGKSPKQYIMNVRMENAKELLLDSDMSILEIGSAVGFDDQNYFSRIFKKHCGMSPNEFRNGY